MQIDPTRWLVSFAGFIVDWLLSREWKKLLWSLTPLLLLGFVAGLVWWGRNLDSGQLAEWYMQLGEQEIADWEQAWAPTAEPLPSAPVDAEETPQELGSAAETPATTDKPSELSRFAEILFRRVQLLAPNDRSQFVIAATLAQRGAIEQAKAMLTRIAPNSQRGYLPAHALLTQFYVLESQQEPLPDDPEVISKRLQHHLTQALDWDRVPQAVLQLGYQLARRQGDAEKSLGILAQSAERNPQDNFELAELCHAHNLQRVEQMHVEPERKYSRIFEQAWGKAQAFFTAEIEADPADFASRIKLANLYVMADQASEKEFGVQLPQIQESDAPIDRAEQILRDGEALEKTPEITLALSELYRFRFLNSVQYPSPAEFSADLKLLDIAMRIDPTNPRVVDTVAALIRFGGQANDALIDHLKSFLAEGKATAITHVMLAENYLVRNEFEQALPHLEQVIQRSPNHTNSLNNLAYVLAERYPSRLDEALEYANRAVAVAAAARQPDADFFDTLGGVLSKMNRGKEAITALETAIELKPQRIDFHERVAAEYRRLGDDSMADKHAEVIQRLQSLAADAQKELVAQPARESRTDQANPSRPAATAGAGDAAIELRPPSDEH